MKKGMGGSVAALAILGLPALVVGMALIDGWALSVAWRWFLVPLGLPSISIPQAIAIDWIIGLVTHQIQPGEQPLWKSVCQHLMRVGLFIVGMWILRACSS